ncbi:MAG: hypothetical protein INH41_01250 [Myxococcaceae bacterium]|jgi:hypothetical protein|nr:hypothetical protein [Myxococcaceae bacterium]MCA3011004.1 hypothetical protein [Myxococcaceae bacterium]
MRAPARTAEDELTTRTTPRALLALPGLTFAPGQVAPMVAFGLALAGAPLTATEGLDFAGWGGGCSQ